MSRAEEELRDYYNRDYAALADTMTPQPVTRDEIARITKALGIVPGHKILDLGCGFGRIANGLAASGADVTGVDVVSEMLAMAREAASRDGLSVEYRQADMAENLGLRGFDAALMWFFAFGHGTETENRKTVREAYRALRPGGQLLVDQHNLIALARSLHVSMVDRGNVIVIHRPVVDMIAGRWGAERIRVEGGEIRRSRFSCRCYSPPEMIELLRQAGFREVRVLGDGFTELTDTSTKIIYAALK